MYGPRANDRWTTIGGVQLDICTPPVDPVTPAQYWWPLHRAARRAELEGWPGFIHLDEFELVGWRARRANLPVWIYLHRSTQAELYVTQEGDLFRVQASRSEPGNGRLLACTVAQAIEHVGLRGPGSIRTAGPAEPAAPLSSEEAGRVVSLLREPGLYRHSREARQQRLLLACDCYADQRLVRWPLGPGAHRLGPEQPEDLLGRCPDHRCARCYREPAASVRPEHLAALHRLFRSTERFPPVNRASAAPALGLVTEGQLGPSRPRPRSRSPYRPLLRQVWPPAGPAPQAGLN